MALEVHEQGNEIFVKAMGAGARDWFADAPQVSKGSVLRELVHPDCWPALENMVAAMIGNRTRVTNMRLKGYLSRFHLSKFISSTSCAGVYVNTVEYVHAIIDVAISAGGVKPAGVIIFNLPDTWQWVAPPNDRPGPSRMPGQWVNAAGRQGEEEVKGVSAAPLERAESGNGSVQLKPHQPSIDLPPLPPAEVARSTSVPTPAKDATPVSNLQCVVWSLLYVCMACLFAHISMSRLHD